MKYINTVYTCICQTLFYMVGKGCPNVFVQKNMPVLFGIMGAKQTLETKNTNTLYFDTILFFNLKFSEVHTETQMLAPGTPSPSSKLKFYAPHPNPQKMNF